MANSLEAICSNVQGEFCATLGLEEGVQEQTGAAIDIIREVAADLPHMEGVAVIPVGSRLKGYATLDSDCDIAMVTYAESAIPFKTRMVIGKVITERLGIKVCQPCFPDDADEALTIDMINYGHAACFDSRVLPFALMPAVFEGNLVAELKHHALKMRSSASDIFYEFMEYAYDRYFINPKFACDAIVRHYIGLLETDGMPVPAFDEIERSLRNAYRQRLDRFGGNVRAKILQELDQN